MAQRGTKGVPKVERMAAIVEAASAAFAAQGYANASVAAIAATAGVTKPLVYSYFESKAGLHAACVRAAGDRLLGEVVAAQRGSYLERAIATIAAILGAIERNPADWTLVMFDPTVHPGMDEYVVVDQYRRAVSGVGVDSVAQLVAESGLPHQAGDERLLAHFWLSMVTDSVTWWMRHPDESIEQTLDRFRRIALIASTSLGLNPA
ncbi:TetR/AcrR family transcriptional regulator [Mycolicibacter minnesotensis]